jgi:hypothetical protein
LHVHEQAIHFTPAATGKNHFPAQTKLVLAQRQPNQPDVCRAFECFCGKPLSVFGRSPRDRYSIRQFLDRQIISHIGCGHGERLRLRNRRPDQERRLVRGSFFRSGSRVRDELTRNTDQFAALGRMRDEHRFENLETVRSFLPGYCP